MNEIRTDGTTVWVDVGTYTVGRFGKLGIDVHTATADGCLHCTHEPTTKEDWRTFVASIFLHHNVRITDEYMPRRFRESHPQERASQRLFEGGQGASPSVAQEAAAPSEDGSSAGDRTAGA